MNSTVTSPADYRWQCRRGMLELDILLNNFVDKQVFNLTLQQQKKLTALLRYPDHALLDLLLGNIVSSDPDIAALVLLIRETPLH